MAALRRRFGVEDLRGKLHRGEESKAGADFGDQRIACQPGQCVRQRFLQFASARDETVALLSDLNSTNGTTVNNAPVQEWQLADGDVIRLGHSEIIVRIH